MRPITLNQVLKDEIRELLPSLSSRDVNNLVLLATRDERKFQAILTDYKLSGKLNKAEIDGFVKWWQGLSGIIKVGAAIVSLA